MAATADPRAKPPAAPSTTHHLDPWAHQQPHLARRSKPVHRPAVASKAGGSSESRDRRRSSSSSSSHRWGGGGAAAQVVGEEAYDGEIEELRAKLMGHLRDAADRLRVPQPSGVPPTPTPPLTPPPPPKAATPPPETEPESEPDEPELRAPPPPPASPLPPPPTEQPLVEAEAKPWKLRESTRRRPATAMASWARAAPPTSSSRRRKRAPFSVALTPLEIEEDIYSLTGGRPRRRPRKRPRAVQRQLDTLFPGLWLTEITADAYRVADE